MAVTLPRADWLKRPGLGAIVRALGGAEGATRLVGGCVRDALAGVVPKDIDLATSLSPDDVIRRLKAADIKAVPTGIAHGTITAVASDGPVEVTTLRRDVSTDGRRATIAYTDNWQEDAARRDFTINALYADPLTGAVFDWFGGMADLERGVVRFIGEPLQRIAEDHLRILRFFRFTARFAKDGPDAEGLSACAARANDLMALSRERIAMELLAILDLPDPGPAIALMIDHGIFRPVLPEIEGAAALARLVAREQDAGIAPASIRRLAALFPPDIGTADDVGARLKLSNAQKKRLISAAARTAEDAANPRALAYWITPELALDRLLLGEDDLTDDTASIANWQPPAFPLTGGAIVARGVKAGPEVARVLQQVQRQWVMEGFPEEPRIREILDQQLSYLDIIS